MADNVTLPGAGAVIAADDCGADGLAQFVKLSYSANGVITPITADVNGLKVQLGVAIPAGDNNIGNVDVVTLPALPAGSNLVGSLKVAETGYTRVSKRVALSASQSGSTIWTPTSGKKFVLTKLFVSCKTAGDVAFYDGTESGNTVITPSVTCGIGGGFILTWEYAFPYRSTAVNTVLKYTSGAGFTGNCMVEGWEE
jgi:hypothetical protein